MDSKQIDVMVADASHEDSRICRNKDEGRESNHRLVRR